jgi:hypothetical protein
MFCLDIETLGLESTAVILSVGIVHYDGESELTYQSLLDTGVFVKFDTHSQRTDYGRTATKSTLDWWRKQSDLAQKTNLLPSINDISVVAGLEILRKWFKSKPDWKTSTIWVRGTLDQPAFESLIRATGDDPFAPFNNYRDVRTALDCLYSSTKNGYVEVDLDKCPDYSYNKVLKHHPLHDAAMDLVQLIAGKQ